MKKITLGIIIGIAISLGTLTFASNAIKLVMIPEYIGGYKSTDLLEYVASQKTIIDNKIKDQQYLDIKSTTPKEVNSFHSA